MKLLAELPTEDVDEPHHRPVAAILGGIAVLAVMLGIGLMLLMSSGTPDDADVTPVDDSSETIDLASWTGSASQACHDVMAEHSALTAADSAAPADIDRGVRALADSLREIPLPTSNDDRAKALAAITVGELAEQAWGGVATLDRDDAADSELAHAEATTAEFFSELAAVGAACP